MNLLEAKIGYEFKNKALLERAQRLDGNLQQTLVVVVGQGLVGVAKQVSALLLGIVIVCLQASPLTDTEVLGHLYEQGFGTIGCQLFAHNP